MRKRLRFLLDRSWFVFVTCLLIAGPMASTSFAADGAKKKSFFDHVREQIKKKQPSPECKKHEQAYRRGLGESSPNQPDSKKYVLRDFLRMDMYGNGLIKAFCDKRSQPGVAATPLTGDLQNREECKNEIINGTLSSSGGDGFSDVIQPACADRSVQSPRLNITMNEEERSCCIMGFLDGGDIFKSEIANSKNREFEGFADCENAFGGSEKSSSLFSISGKEAGVRACQCHYDTEVSIPISDSSYSNLECFNQGFFQGMKKLIQSKTCKCFEHESQKKNEATNEVSLPASNGKSVKDPGLSATGGAGDDRNRSIIAK